MRILKIKKKIVQLKRYFEHHFSFLFDILFQFPFIYLFFNSPSLSFDVVSFRNSKKNKQIFSKKIFLFTNFTFLKNKIEKTLFFFVAIFFFFWRLSFFQVLFIDLLFFLSGETPQSFFLVLATPTLFVK